MFKLLLPVLLLGSQPAMSQNRYEVLITEIMADPSPPVGLPAVKWIELRNVSGRALSLQNWRLADAGSNTGPMPAFLLQPDSFVLVTTASAVSQLANFGRTVSVTNFLSLRLAGDRVVLVDGGGKVIHALEYTTSFYGNALKAEGGWTLEMIDVRNPCGSNKNWTASVDPGGGTPGRKNSVERNNPDTQAPLLERTWVQDPLTVVALFNEPLDSAQAAQAGKYSIPGIAIRSAEVQPPFFKQVVLRLGQALITGSTYSVTATNLADCAGNVMSKNLVRTGIPQPAAKGDIVVSEILFNPKPGAFDFVEVFNGSDKILDAAQLFIANRSSTGVLGFFKAFSEGPFYVYPKEYVVLTPDILSLQNTYFVPLPEHVIPIALPSLPDDKGNVVLLNQQGEIVDDVSYSEKWHFPLISDRQGVSLERISAAGASQDPQNWTSAASTVGFATPTYKNSQSRAQVSSAGMVSVAPAIFSPDNDGHDDFAVINYQLSQPGFVGNVIVFDASGRPVRHLVTNATLGQSGSWNWNGLGDKQQKLNPGNYVIMVEVFNLVGKREHFKKAISLSQRLN